MARAAPREHWYQRATTHLHVLITLLITFILVGTQMASVQGQTRETWDHLPADEEISEAKKKYIAGLTFTRYVDGDDCYEKKGCAALEDGERMDCAIDCSLIDYLPVDPNQPAITESKITETEIVKAHDPKRAKLHGAEGMVEEVYAFLLYTRPETRVDRADRSNAKEVVVYGIAQLQNGPSDPWVFWDAGEFSTRAERDAKLNSWFQSGGGPLVRGFPGEPEPGKKKPCPAAVRAFGLDPNSNSNRTMDYDDITGQFQDAIAQYNLKHGDKPARLGESGIGMVPVLSWLANQGGTADFVSKQFVFATDEDRAAWERETKTVYPNDTDRWGTERRLYGEMIRMSEASGGRKLTPGDIFYLALEQRNGNATEAALLAHNVLRSLARENDGPLTGVYPEISFFQNRLKSLIDPEPLGRGQNAGATYHLFTTITLEMYARGNWSLNTLATYTIDRLGQFMRDEIQHLARIVKKDPNLELPETRSAISVFANQVEQFYRKYKTSSPDDPDKYCYNVIGAQLGAWLHRTLSGVKLPEAPPTDTPVQIPHVQHHVMSPASITWSGNGYSMTLDQQSQTLTGYYPLILEPFYEADTDSWGVSWLDLLGKPYVVTLEATQDGFVHMLSVGTGTGGSFPEARVLPIPVQTGDVVTMDIEPDFLAGQAIVNGTTVIQPLTVPVQQDASQPQGVQVGGGKTRLVIVILLVFVAGLAVLLLLLLSKRRKRSPRRAPVQAQAGHGPATSCPSCGATARPGARFCEQCGGPVAAAAPPPVRSGGNRCLFVVGIGVLVLLCLLTLVAAGFLYFSPLGRQMIGLAASPATAPIAVVPATATSVPPVPAVAELPPATATSAPVPAPTEPPSSQEGMLATPTAPAQPPAAAPSPALTDRQRLDDHSLFDDFSSDALGWSQRNNESAETGYANEQYFMLVKKTTYWVMSKVPGDFPHTVIEFDAAVAPGSAEGMYGVICHYQDGDNYDFVAIDPETSSFSAGRLLAGEFQFLSGAADGTTEQRSQYLAPALTASNHIQVGCYDDWLEVVIGGHSEGAWPLDPHSAAGSAALFVYGFKDLGQNGYKVLFDNVGAGQ